MYSVKFPTIFSNIFQGYMSSVSPHLALAIFVKRSSRSSNLIFPRDPYFLFILHKNHLTFSISTSRNLLTERNIYNKLPHFIFSNFNISSLQKYTSFKENIFLDAQRFLYCKLLLRYQLQIL